VQVSKTPRLHPPLRDGAEVLTEWWKLREALEDPSVPEYNKQFAAAMAMALHWVMKSRPVVSPVKRMMAVGPCEFVCGGKP
jgi:hypothetical protein